jgi:hypothetical protein
LAIPRADLGLAGTAEIRFDFHWADNVQVPGDINQFAISGDSAPDRKFNYRYNSDLTPPSAPAGLTAQAASDRITLTWTNPTDADLVGSIVRVSTTGYPATPDDGELLADVRTHEPVAVVEHTDLARGSYYYAVFAYDEMLNYSQGAQAFAFFSAAPGPAVNPQPADEATWVALTPSLTWTAGPLASIHNVYFGSASDALDLRQAQASTAFSPGRLEYLTTYYWRIDEVNGPETTVGAVWSFTTRPYGPDFDGDGDVDQADFGHLQACFGGVGTPQLDPLCQNAALDGDLDVDASDLSIFRTCLGGPGVLPPPTCAAP